MFFCPFNLNRTVRKRYKVDLYKQIFKNVVILTTVFVNIQGEGKQNFILRKDAYLIVFSYLFFVYFVIVPWIMGEDEDRFDKSSTRYNNINNLLSVIVNLS